MTILNPKTVSILVRMEPEEREIINRVAKHLGQSTNEWSKETLLRVARTKLVPNQPISMNDQHGQ